MFFLFMIIFFSVYTLGKFLKKVLLIYYKFIKEVYEFYKIYISITHGIILKIEESRTIMSDKNKKRKIQILFLLQIN